MANTKATGGKQQNFVTLTAMDEDFDDGVYRELDSIQFNPGATSDVLVVLQGNAAGPILFKVTADSSSDETIKYFHGIPARVFVDYSACTLSSGHEVIITYREAS